MNFSVLTHRQLFRSGSNFNGCLVAERYSADFLIDGDSLLSILVKIDGGHDDYMGCFIKGFSEYTAKAASMLLSQTLPNSESGRVLLYLCPECGDIGCGAYAVRIEKTDIGYLWADFAYENGYEEPRAIDGVGPFIFELSVYESAISRATAV